LPEGFEKQAVLFNLNRIGPMESVIRPVIIVESYWSVMRLHALGYPIISPMGHLVSERQCELLASRKVEKVIVLFDGDEAGELGITESVPLLSRWFYVRAPQVPNAFKPHKASEAELEKLTARCGR
jgi:DNA primase